MSIHRVSFTVKKTGAQYASLSMAIHTSNHLSLIKNKLPLIILLLLKREYFAHEIDNSQTLVIENSNFLSKIDHNNFLGHFHCFKQHDDCFYH